MMNMYLLLITVVPSFQVKGANIMLNKPSVQSGTMTYNSHAVDSFSSSKANDGSKTGYPSLTPKRQDPYWQGDLQGFYTVSSISVSSIGGPNFIPVMKNAIIGVSAHDVSSPESEVIRCGQWPAEEVEWFTKSFNCPHAGPVRFVRIWREAYGHLNLAEVEVEGEPSRFTVYDKITSQMITTPTTSLFVTSVTDCGTKCYQTQPCLAFSYSLSEEPNCLLATDVTMTSDVKWASFKLKPPFTAPICT